MFNNYYPKLKILKTLTSSNQTTDFFTLNKSLKLRLPKNVNRNLILAEVLHGLYVKKLIKSNKEPELKNIGECTFDISDDGLRELQDAEERTLRFWLPVILSNVFSFAALIIAILSYIKQ